MKQRFLSSPYPDLSVSGKAVTSVFKLNFALSPSIVMRACKGNLSVILLRLPACEEQNSECTLHLVYQFCIGKRSKTVCKKGRCPAFFANCPRNKVAIPIRDTSGTPVFTEKAPEFAPLTAENPTGKPRWNAFQRGFPVGFSAVSGANSGAFSVKTGVPEVSRIGIATLFRGQLAKNAGHLPFLQTVLLRFPIQNW